MKDAVIYARVSSKEQEQGYSIDAQLDLLRDYAVKHDFHLLHEFREVETAKKAGRTIFSEMLKYISRTSTCTTILVEKTDRLYRNLRDWVTLEEMKLDIHLVKEGMIIGPNARSSDMFFHGIRVLMAKNYIDNLREETLKGMNQKVQEGGWPGKAPFGYMNNMENHTVEVHPEEAVAVRWLFTQYAAGGISLKTLVRQFHQHGFQYRGKRQLSISRLQQIFRSPFYKGLVQWDGKIYPGNHEAIVDLAVWDAVQAVMDDKSRPKQRDHDFTYKGVLTCGHCGCGITAALHKKKYVYYRCTEGHGMCRENGYINEEQLDVEFKQALLGIRIDPDLARGAAFRIKEVFATEINERSETVARLEKRVHDIEARMEAAYNDKLDGKIEEKFWQKQHNKYVSQRQDFMTRIQAYATANTKFYEMSELVLKLAVDAVSAFENGDIETRREIINLVLWNCTLTSGKAHYSYKKPFDIIAEGCVSANWQP